MALIIQKSASLQLSDTYTLRAVIGMVDTLISAIFYSPSPFVRLSWTTVCLIQNLTSRHVQILRPLNYTDFSCPRIIGELRELIQRVVLWGTLEGQFLTEVILARLFSLGLFQGRHPICHSVQITVLRLRNFLLADTG